jgi:hypothetical protein
LAEGIYPQTGLRSYIDLPLAIDSDVDTYKLPRSSVAGPPDCQIEANPLPGAAFNVPTCWNWVMTDSQGLASTTYTLSKTAKTVTVTASSPGLATVTFTATGTPGSPRWVLVQSGNQQTAPVTTLLPLPLVVKVSDSYGNGISGITVNFSAGTFGGTLSASSAVTNSLGAPV